MLLRSLRFFLLAFVVVGCGARTGLPVPDAGPETCVGPACACGPTAFVGVITRGTIDKIDLLLAVDNSQSMADKQRILALAIPDLIVGLVNPKCLDDVTNQPVLNQPTGPLEPCPAGSTRNFTPVTDIHIGVVSSSMGTFGADGCPDKPPSSCAITPNTISNDDRGHLITRSDPCGTGIVPTYQNQGFLAWDPAQKLMPPGESQIGDPTAAPPVPGLATSLHDLVVGDGQDGCGYESQDEAWYRFLVDPAPWSSISLENNVVQTSGVDSVLLEQRKQFLRPDSLLAIMVVSDETDTSVKQTASYPLFAAPELYLPHPRQECSTNGPNDPCCASCGDPAPPGCGPDPNCASSPNYSPADEDTGIHAFGLITHKARYGIEFFYQPSRYVTALTSANLKDDNGKSFANPIYSNLDPSVYTGAVRDPSLVFYAAVVGVPWQLVARQRNGVPDLVNGVSALDPSQVGGFKTPKELALTDPHGNTFWDDIAGDPEHYVPALSPFMQEATVPRFGADPITGAVVMPPSTPNGMGATVGGALLNDHERNLKLPGNDIQYACVFPIPTPLDCFANPNTNKCPCTDVDGTGQEIEDNPLCAPNPSDPSGHFTLQVKAKAYPGLKELAIAEGMGDQGIAASICAKQLDDPTKSDYGYRPSVNALLDRLSQTLGEQCLTKQLTPNIQGQVSCAVIEARNTAGEACTCDPAASRIPIPEDDQCYQVVAEQDPRNATAKWNCFCEITQTSGDALHACQTDVGPTPGDGFCYVDPTIPAPFTGNPALVKGCPEEDRRVVRFVGNGAPTPGATIFIGCR
jgi:hypothetical protein